MSRPRNDRRWKRVSQSKHLPPLGVKYRLSLPKDECSNVGHVLEQPTLFRRGLLRLETDLEA